LFFFNLKLNYIIFFQYNQVNLTSSKVILMTSKKT
jgi:hypothetical protein